jgi:hypothetical protein
MGEMRGTEEHPREQHEAQVDVQHVVEAVVGEIGGRGDVQAALERLETGIAAAGLPPQPATWLKSTATEIAAGRLVIVDRRIDPNIRERTGTSREGGEFGENAVDDEH